MQSTDQRLPENHPQVKPEVSGQVPFTCKESNLRWHIEAKKCSCGSSWCSICWNRRGKKAAQEKLKSMSWEFVREVMVSTDRGRFSDAETCHKEITSGRGIGNLIKDLERMDGIPVVDYIAFLEWYSDGYPHWHIFIEVEVPGREGMIGYQKIKRRWPHGLWVTEKYIESEKHWKNIIGYFDNHGYFADGKGYQDKLPEWALKRPRRIRRWVGKHEGDKELQRLSRMDWNAQDENNQSGRMVRVGERKNYKEILDGCGAKTFIKLSSNSSTYSLKVNINYQQIKAGWAWEYKEGKGLTMSLSSNDKEAFILKLREMSEERATTERAIGHVVRSGNVSIITEKNISLRENLTDCVIDVEQQGEGYRGVIKLSGDGCIL
jgi:hypothetical protein